MELAEKLLILYVFDQLLGGRRQKGMQSKVDAISDNQDFAETMLFGSVCLRFLFLCSMLQRKADDIRFQLALEHGADVAPDGIAGCGLFWALWAAIST